MSCEAITFIKAKRIPSSPQKLLAVMIAEHTSNKTGRCYPGQALLADECTMSERQVREHAKALEDIGIIRRYERRKKDGSQQWNSHEYELVGFLEWLARAQEDARKPSGGNPPEAQEPTGGNAYDPVAETRSTHRRKPAAKPSEENHKKRTTRDSASAESARAHEEAAEAKKPDIGFQEKRGAQDQHPAKPKPSRKRQPDLLDLPSQAAPAAVPAAVVQEAFDLILAVMGEHWGKTRISDRQRSLMRQLIQSQDDGIEYVRELSSKLATAKFALGENESGWIISLNQILEDSRKREEIWGRYQQPKLDLRTRGERKNDSWMETLAKMDKLNGYGPDSEPEKPEKSIWVAVCGQRMLRQNVLDVLMEFDRGNGDWRRGGQLQRMYGPPPGHPDCRIPSELIAEAKSALAETLS